MGKIGRNEPCYCGSGKKHKRCCLDGNAYRQGSYILDELQQRIFKMYSDANELARNGDYAPAFWLYDALFSVLSMQDSSFSMQNYDLLSEHALAGAQKDMGVCIRKIWETGANREFISQCEKELKSERTRRDAFRRLLRLTIYSPGFVMGYIDYLHTMDRAFADDMLDLILSAGYQLFPELAIFDPAQTMARMIKELTQTLNITTVGYIDIEKLQNDEKIAYFNKFIDVDSSRRHIIR